MKLSSSSWIVFLQHCRWCKRDSFSCWEASFLDRFCALFPRVTIKTVRLPLSALVPLLQVSLCPLSSFDTAYTVQYSPDSMVSYVGKVRTVISYNFSLNIWTMRDVINPNVTAVSEASLRSLAIGNINWTVTNDLLCSRGSNVMKCT